MSAVVSIFGIIGVVCGMAFPEVSGSIVAYLAVEYPLSKLLQVASS